MKIEYTLSATQEKILTASAESAKQTLNNFCNGYISTALDAVVTATKENQMSKIKETFANTTVLDLLSSTKPDKVTAVETAINSVSATAV